MNQPENPESHPNEELSREELMEALFANLVVQQSNMALMFLGKAPSPEDGQSIVDLDNAKLIIDQLEMLEAKTKGNLSKQEATLLQQTLMALRMGFVEAVNASESASAGTGSKSAPPAGAPTPSAASAPTGVPPPDADADSRKKFTKKY